ncbi:glycosyltransferase family 2 protein [Brevibacterium yomogidense]|uniref:glycosyltransferase family 2 protein n=1 Tax=Brevibacterium yomogidense TaxID=946573 RepID=UPI0018DFC6DC|nr:glycosyltransferase [Brevibacterium yomogidense]
MSDAHLRPSDVTVLVVAYRHADYVVECLESIRLQTVKPDRVIIADDASPDNTSAVVSAYLTEHRGFGELHTNAVNIGLNRTLNKHLATVASTYVTYISADDIMLPERIEKHFTLMDSAPDAALAYSDALVIDEESNILHETSQLEFPWPDSVDSRAAPFAALLHTNWMPAASLFLRTALLQDAGGYREDLFYEDFELLVRLSKHHQFVWTEEPLVGVRRLATSLGSTGFSSTNPAFLIALDAALRHYSDAAPPLRTSAASKRWELAKRASASSMPARKSLALLWNARSGASSRLASSAHLARWVLNIGRRLFSRPSASRSH